jgi:hypothetical protein
VLDAASPSTCGASPQAPPARPCSPTQTAALAVAHVGTGSSAFSRGLVAAGHRRPSAHPCQYGAQISAHGAVHRSTPQPAWFLGRTLPSLPARAVAASVYHGQNPSSKNCAHRALQAVRRVFVSSPGTFVYQRVAPPALHPGVCASSLERHGRSNGSSCVLLKSFQPQMPATDKRCASSLQR